ncbi:MAG: sulfurtransferase TusA family protein [Alphaproteobacteria bacterium]|nr:MAG: sulfurtransferase TusA family protein [Alphaproteobacteria bacterium]
MTTPTQTLDATGLLCPLPVLRAQRKLRSMKAGEVLEVLATDPASKTDMPAFCDEAGHALISAEEVGEMLVYRIRKGG